MRSTLKAIAISIPLLLLISAATGAGETWTFVEPTEGLVPFPVFPEAEYDGDLSTALSAVVSRLDGGEGKRVAAYTVKVSAERVKGFYEDQLPILLEPLSIKLSDLVRRLGPLAGTLGIPMACLGISALSLRLINRVLIPKSPVNAGNRTSP